MKRIGTTDDGRILLEATAAELLEVDSAIVTLIQFRDACAATAPAELRTSAAVARALEPKTKKTAATKNAKSTKSGTKTCTKCGQDKAASEFYTGHAKCKPCFLEHQKTAKAAKAPQTAGEQKPDPTRLRSEATPGRERFAQMLSKTCRTCKTEKPLGEFDKFQRSCLACMTAKPKPVQDQAPKKSRMELIREADRRAKLKATPREHDPDLDRPVEGGRVLPVGGEG